MWQDPEAENSQGQKLDNDISPIDVTASASGNTAEGFPEAAAAIQEIDQELPKQFENLKVCSRNNWFKAAFGRQWAHPHVHTDTGITLRS